MFFDRGTKWLEAYPVTDKTADAAETCMIDFATSREDIQNFHSDNAPELLRAAKNRGWRIDPATPGRPETNGDAENKVRRVVEGSRTQLEHAGLPPCFHSHSPRHFLSCA